MTTSAGVTPPCPLQIRIHPVSRDFLPPSLPPPSACGERSRTALRPPPVVSEVEPPFFAVHQWINAFQPNNRARLCNAQDPGRPAKHAPHLVPSSRYPIWTPRLIRAEEHRCTGALENAERFPSAFTIPQSVPGIGRVRRSRNGVRGHGSNQGDTGTLNSDRLESGLQAADGRRPPEGGTPTGTVRPPGVTWFPQILNQAHKYGCSILADCSPDTL